MKERLKDEVVDTTHDGAVRARPPAGLVARGARGAIDLAEVVIGEVALPERALREGLNLEGPLQAVQPVENLGAWQDLPAPDGWLMAHVPGWDTATVEARPYQPRAPREGVLHRVISANLGSFP